jgi:hypothetical protein
MKNKIICILFCLILMIPIISTTAIANQPPTTPEIDGSTNGKAGVQYTYGFRSTDPDGDDVSYCVNWSDGTGEVCIGPFASSEKVTDTHTWSEEGTYVVKVKARDIYNAESDWATLIVTMPYSHNKPILPFLELLFQRFPHAFPLLRQLIGY